MPEGRPPTHDELNNGHARHRDCGGVVASSWDYRANDYSFQCSKCLQVWRAKYTGKWSDEDRAARFYMEVRPDGVVYVMVWIVDPVTKMRHMSSVPAWAVGDRERVRW
jgi:hypothetical protein